MTDSIKLTIDEIRLKSFRAFKNTRLPLSDLTYLIGRNGAGKSCLIDAFDFLRESVSDSLENAIDRRGGLDDIQYKETSKFKKTSVGISIVFNIKIADVRKIKALYGMEIGVNRGNNYPIVSERMLATKQDSYIRYGKEIDISSDISPPSGNLILPLIARSNSLWESILDAIRNIRAHELSPSKMSVTTEITDKSSLMKDGSNAGDSLKAVGRTEDHQWIVDRIGRITTGIENINAESLYGRRILQFMQCSSKGRLWLNASQVSQGTLKSLGVLLALRQIPTPSIVLIDEIENSVHPSALSVLLEAAYATSNKTQVVLSSHSPEVLSHYSVTGQRVRLIERNDGESYVYMLNKDTQSAINEIDTVGWMLRSNTLWKGPSEEKSPEDIFELPKSDNEKI